MKKKMTFKEFKRVLEDVAHMPLDIWGYEGLLNSLALTRRYCADTAEKLGCESAKCDREIATQITDYLTQIGYFD